MRRMLIGVALLAVLYVAVPAQEKSEIPPVTKSFIAVDSPVVALEHVPDGQDRAAQIAQDDHSVARAQPFAARVERFEYNLGIISRL